MRVCRDFFNLEAKRKLDGTVTTGGSKDNEPKRPRSVAAAAGSESELGSGKWNTYWLLVFTQFFEAIRMFNTNVKAAAWDSNTFRFYSPLQI